MYHGAGANDGNLRGAGERLMRGVVVPERHQTQRETLNYTPL